MKPFWWLYILCPIILLALGFGSSYLSNSGNNNSWYNSLAKAPWTPPGWVFSVVWSILYILLGIILARIIVEKQFVSQVQKIQLGLFIALLVIILVWPFAYFLAKSQASGISLIILVVLLGLAYCILTGINKQYVEMGCIIPLLIWGSYATTLACYPVLLK